VNEGRGGDVSDDLARFRKALAEWPPDVVVLLLGTNDAVCNPRLAPFCASSTATPERTVANLLRMADEARGVGATVLILTPPPAVCTGSCATKHAAAFATAVRDAFTARVAEELRHTHPPAGVRVADLRGRFTDASWEALSLDGLHPSAEGDRIIAAFVAAHIPRPRAAGDTSKARAARDTSKARVAPDTSPFARHPLDGSPAD
jgi:lysophospholipase L1-like esterase